MVVSKILQLPYQILRKVQEYLSEEAGTFKRIRRKSDRGIALPDDRTDQLPDGRYSEMIVGPLPADRIDLIANVARSRSTVKLMLGQLT
jgi:hypothetical protein